MKILVILLLVVLLFMVGCTKELEVYETYQDIPFFQSYINDDGQFANIEDEEYPLVVVADLSVCLGDTDLIPMSKEGEKCYDVDESKLQSTDYMDYLSLLEGQKIELNRYINKENGGQETSLIEADELIESLSSIENIVAIPVAFVIPSYNVDPEIGTSNNIHIYSYSNDRETRRAYTIEIYDKEGFYLTISNEILMTEDYDRSYYTPVEKLSYTYFHTYWYFDEFYHYHQWPDSE
ncbi:MAG: hypothetical protein R3Y57_04105 [Erysipelotrichaceae bacterium]